MPIFDQGYQHWDGRLAGHAWRWLAIARRGVAAQWKARGVKLALLTALGPATVLSLFLIAWGLVEQQADASGAAKNETVELILRFLQLPEEVKAGPKGFRVFYWTMAFHYFFAVELFFSMLLVLLVGPNLISQDLRYNAIPLYFSRPVRRLDYFLGKLGVIAAYVAAVTIGPAVVAYLVGAAFSNDLSVFRDTWRVLAASVGYGAVVAVSAGTLMLAISSLSKNSRMVGSLWVGAWVLSWMVSTSLGQSVRQDWCPIVSYQADLLRLREAMLDTPSARAKFVELVDVGRAQQQRVRLLAPLFARGRMRPTPPPPPPRRPPQPGYDANGNATFPWTWSAGVLAGLWTISAWTLSTRVKSLDRLR